MNTKSIVTLLGLLGLCMTPGWSPAQPASENATTPTTEQVMEQFRTDMQAAAADVMAKGLTLTAEQAAKFWPMFETFQKEQKSIIDEQLQALAKYQETYTTMSDADALGYAKSLLQRDQRIHDLRVKYLAKFQEVVPPRISSSRV